MARRRVYVFDLAAILSDAPPPKKSPWPSLLLAALTGVLSALTIVLFRLIIQNTPASKLEAGVMILGAYTMILLIFTAVAFRTRHRNL